jgi:hypothetical protein
MTYVGFHERPERTTQTAIVSKPPGDLKALAKQAPEEQFAESKEIEYPPDEHTTNIRVAGARLRRDRAN